MSKELQVPDSPEFPSDLQIWMDESGYTGDDLAIDGQPVFGLASLAISDERALEWRNEFFGDIAATELKHKNLNKRPEDQDAVIAFLSDQDVRSALKISITHKKYALLCRYVDYIIEEEMQERGMPLYEHGGNIALANTLWYTIDPLSSSGTRDRFLLAFQRWVRERSTQRFKYWTKIIRHLAANDSLRLLVAPALSAINRRGEQCLTGVPLSMALDVSLAAMLSLVAQWSRGHERLLMIGHDRASALTKQKAIWDRIAAPSVPNVVVGYDRRTIQYPLRVRNTAFVEAARNVAVQLADVAAGAAATFGKGVIAGSASRGKYESQLAEVMSGGMVSHAVWPTQNFDRHSLGTETSGGIDPAGFLGQLVARDPDFSEKKA